MNSLAMNAATAPAATARSVLRDIFGYRSFRPGQEEIIARLVSGGHTLAVMPTGAGKSLCFQIPAILDRRLAIVVSPLVALMDDQVAALRAHGVAVACIHSGHERETNVAEWRRVASGEASLLYLSPERLMTPRMIEALKRIDPGLLVVDEAHCISKWGASFRPEYEKLGELADHFPQATIAAFTATADKATREDIAHRLFRGRGRTIVHGFDRPNLYLAAAAKGDWKSQLVDFLEERRDQSGVVYCLSRRFTDEVAAFLAGRGFNAIAYHAGHAPEVRQAAQRRFMSENATMVATIAFGMGIDKPDIRFVCHLNLPGSMEAFYQEIGRAGRDGLAADTQLFFGLDDIRLRRQFIENDGEDRDHILREHKRLDSLVAYAESAGCRRQALLAYFDEESEPCGNCDNCLYPPELADGTELAVLLFDAIRATGGSFGAAHLIDVLRGADTAKIRQHGHDGFACFGTGAGKPKSFWQSFIRQAVSAGCITINIQNYGCLELTARGVAVLEGEASFRYREPPREVPSDDKPRRRASASVSAEDAPLFERLKALRRDLARERNVPAYVIFADATLIEMAKDRPSTMDQLGRVNGIGPKKLADYGQAFLALTRAAAYER
jgi:ATP-dependent DNA helicase RecQ